MSDLKQRLRPLVQETLRYLQLAHLTLTAALLLVLAPVAGALVLAANGLPAASALIKMIIAALSLWGAAWSFNDLINALRNDQTHSLILRGVRSPNQAIALVAFLTITVLLMAVLLGSRFGSFLPLALLVIFTYPWLRKRTYLIEAWAGLGIAWMVPLAYTALGRWPDKVGALLGVVTLLWATGWFVLYQWPQHATLLERGMRSLGQMFDVSTGYLVIALQVAMVAGAWMAMNEAKLGPLAMYALAITAALILWQAALIHLKGSSATRQALVLHTLAGASLWSGIIIQILSTTHS